jgi:hypothetical protein
MDDVFRLAWRRYRTWAVTAGNLKKSDDSWKQAVLVLTIVGTIAGTLGPFSSRVSLGLPHWTPAAAGYLGAAALALATYFGKQLLDASHQQNWTGARAAAEAFKSESCKYAVQAPPYNADDRMSRLSTRIAELDELTKGHLQRAIADAEATRNMPSAPWSLEDYVVNRLNEQVKWYSDRADKYERLSGRGRWVALLLGAAAALLSIFSATKTDGTLPAACLGIVTTVGAAVGAYFQAGHYEATTLKYRETAQALQRKLAEFRSVPTPQNQQQFVIDAETMMQAENAAWLSEVASRK